LKQLLLRAINKNQLLILSQIEKDIGSISSILRNTSKAFNISLSTLKFNAKVLRKLNLIEFGTVSSFKPAKLTELGKLVIEIIGNGYEDEIDEKQIKVRERK